MSIQQRPIVVGIDDRDDTLVVIGPRKVAQPPRIRGVYRTARARRARQ